MPEALTSIFVQVLLAAMEAGTASAHLNMLQSAPRAACSTPALAKPPALACSNSQLALVPQQWQAQVRLFMKCNSRILLLPCNAWSLAKSGICR